jgi:hypothetical protein
MDIDVDKVWARLRKVPAYSKMGPHDFRPSVYNQTFDSVGSGVTAVGNQTFQGGAIIVRVDGYAYIPGVAAAGGQSPNNRQLFGAHFAYSNGDILTPGGPVPAEALFGPNGDRFPLRELIIQPTQLIIASVQNLSTTALNIRLTYHTLSYRLG